MSFIFCIFLLSVTLACDQFADCKDEKSAIVLFNAKESFDVSAISIVSSLMKKKIIHRLLNDLGGIWESLQLILV